VAPTEQESAGAAGGGLYAGLIGQERAVAQLRAAARSPVHAYLLVRRFVAVRGRRVRGV
jgi:hypothetical protein